MEVYLKKYFWTLGVIVVVICTVFTAKGVNHYIAARFLTVSAEPQRAQRRAAGQNEQSQTRSKSGQPLAERNMFCSECEPPQQESEEPAPAVAGDTVPETSLPLRLVATNVSSREEYSFATIQNTESEKQGAYWTGDSIPDAGAVVSVRGKYVDFRNEDSNRVERISLLSKKERKTKKKPTRKRRRRRRAKSKPKNELMAMIDEGVKKTGDNQYEIDRQVVQKVLANPAAVARGARIVPSIKNGKPNGFKLYAIRPSSVYAKVGLMNGDTIHAINGFELTTADKALEVYTKVRSASNITVNATRRGKPVTLKYSIE